MISEYEAIKKILDSNHITYIDDIESDEEEELDEELCTQCGGTGIQPKKNFVDDTDFSGVENELMI